MPPKCIKGQPTQRGYSLQQIAAAFVKFTSALTTLHMCIKKNRQKRRPMATAGICISTCSRLEESLTLLVSQRQRQEYSIIDQQVSVGFRAQSAQVMSGQRSTLHTTPIGWQLCIILPNCSITQSLLLFFPHDDVRITGNS